MLVIYGFGGRGGLLLVQMLEIVNKIVATCAYLGNESAETITPNPMKLEEQLRRAIRVKHYSLKTEETYVGWYRRYVLWAGKRHPGEMGAAEVEGFLTWLAVERGVVAVTQNQALNALIFLYKEVLKVEVEGINAQRAKSARRMPVVLTSEEAGRLMRAVKGDAGMVCRLLYGCGLRVAEGLALRVKDVDVGGGKLEVRGGKGDKDRVMTLPKSLVPALTEHLARLRQLYEADRREGKPGVFLPGAMKGTEQSTEHRVQITEQEQPHAGETWPWFWLFPAVGESLDPRSGVRRRHHIHEIGISRELARATELAQIGKRVTAHVLRHSFATHLILRGVDIRSLQTLMGHADVRTTQVYTETARAMRGEITSPLDDL